MALPEDLTRFLNFLHTAESDITAPGKKKPHPQTDAITQKTLSCLENIKSLSPEKQLQPLAKLLEGLSHYKEVASQDVVLQELKDLDELIGAVKKTAVSLLSPSVIIQENIAKTKEGTELGLSLRPEQRARSLYFRALESAYIQGIMSGQSQSLGLYFTLEVLRKAVHPQTNIPGFTETGKMVLENILKELEFTYEISNGINASALLVAYGSPSPLREAKETGPIALSERTLLSAAITDFLVTKILQKVSSLKVGDVLVLPGSYANVPPKQGHGVLYHIFPKSNGNFSLFITNTGELPKESLHFSEGSRIWELAYTDIPPTTLNREFFTKLIQFQNLQVPEEERNIDALYNYLDAQLNTGNNLALGRKHTLQTAASCSSKPLFIFLHDCLGDRNYQALKTWITLEAIHELRHLHNTSPATFESLWGIELKEWAKPLQRLLGISPSFFYSSGEEFVKRHEEKTIEKFEKRKKKLEHLMQREGESTEKLREYGPLKPEELKKAEQCFKDAFDDWFRGA